MLFLDRMVRDTESYPEQKRLAPGALGDSDCLCGDQVGGMPLLVEEAIVAVPGAIAIFVAVSILVDLSVEVAVALLKSILARPDLGTKAQVPLTHQGSEVSASPERAGQSDRAPGQGNSAPIRNWAVDTEPGGIAAGQQSRTSR